MASERWDSHFWPGELFGFCSKRDGEPWSNHLMPCSWLVSC